MTQGTMQRAVKINEDLVRAKIVYEYTSDNCQIAILTTHESGISVTVPSAARNRVTEAIHEAIGEYIKSLESELEQL